MSELDQIAEKMFTLTTGDGHPYTSVFNERFRNLPALHWNIKVMGAELAQRYYGDVRATRKALHSDAFELGWRPVRFKTWMLYGRE